MDSQEIIYKIGIFIIPFLFSISVHEAAHAFVANRLGDPTAKNLGRLTLNPIPHIDIFGSVIFPILAILAPGSLLFGWAKPVPVNHLNLRDVKKSFLLISLAGPVSNLITAIVSVIIYRILLNFYSFHLITESQGFSIVKPLVIVMDVMITLNIILAFFNLIPIPPLDGSKILAGLLPDRYSNFIHNLERYGFIILIIFIMSGLFRIILDPALQLIRLLKYG